MATTANVGKNLAGHKINWVGVSRLSIGCTLAAEGAYHSNGNLVSFAGFAALLGAISILLEIGFGHKFRPDSP